MKRATTTTRGRQQGTAQRTYGQKMSILSLFKIYNIFEPRPHTCPTPLPLLRWQLQLTCKLASKTSNVAGNWVTSGSIRPNGPTNSLSRRATASEERQRERQRVSERGGRNMNVKCSMPPFIDILRCRWVSARQAMINCAARRKVQHSSSLLLANATPSASFCPAAHKVAATCLNWLQHKPNFDIWLRLLAGAASRCHRACH